LRLNHKKMAKKENKTVINQLVVKSPTRKSYDVGTWRSALVSADAGRVKTLLDLFEDLLIDGVLFDAVEKRVQAVTNSPVTFQDVNGVEVDEMAALIDSNSFEELVKTIMASMFWGRSGGEFQFNENGFSFEPIPMKHIRPENKVILINDSDENGIPYEADPFLLVLGKPRQFGMLLKAAPYIIWKRGGFGDYAQWLEIFGMPQRVGKYSSYDAESRRLLEQAMESAGSAPWIVVPKETEVETTNNGGGGSGDNYNDFRRACNEEVLITILGQTLTTTQNDTGARSLGEVHKAVEEGKNRADIRFVQRVLNTHVLPLLEARGYPVKGGKFVFPEAATELTVADVVSLSELIEIPAQFLHDKFSIPMPQNGEPIARRQAAAPEPIPGDENPKEEDDPDDGDVEPQRLAAQKKEIKNADITFWERVMRFFAEAPAMMTGAVRGIFLSDPNDVTQIINVDKIVKSALKDIHQSLGKPENNASVNEKLFNLTNDVLWNGAEKAFKVAGAEWGRKNEAFINEFRTNTAVFSAFKNHEQTQKIVDLLRKEDGSVRGFSEFKKEALKVSDGYNKNWLQTEYNTAVRSSRMAVNWKKFQETKRLYPNLEYLPSRAANPRDSHRPLWNLVFAMDDPIWNKIMPPSEWNCLCGVRNTDKPVTPLPAGFDWPVIDPVFAHNPGVTASIVNTPETGYYKDCPEIDRSLVIDFAKRWIEKLLK
jgi:hypothetical protein